MKIGIFTQARAVALSLFAGVLSASFARAVDVTGAGASFVYPVMSKWAADYDAAAKGRVNYQSIGSGGGIAQIKAKTVDFGSTDAPLNPKDLAAAGLAQFPSVMGAVVPVYNIPGILPGKIRLNGTVLADIYLGKIKMWNDPAIVALNTETVLPALAVRVIHRSDGSGTTFNFTNYLSKVSVDWKAKVGEGIAVRWPQGAIGGKGNEGVSAYVRQIKGGIGYVELSYVIRGKLSYINMQNAAGKFVMPNVASIKAAAASADWKSATDHYLVITNAAGEGAWPIAATNFMLIPKAPKNVEKAKAALAFFDWAYANGDASADALGYVALPDELVTMVKGYWTQNLKF